MTVDNYFAAGKVIDEINACGEVDRACECFIQGACGQSTIEIRQGCSVVRCAVNGDVAKRLVNLLQEINTARLRTAEQKLAEL